MFKIRKDADFKQGIRAGLFCEYVLREAQLQHAVNSSAVTHRAATKVFLKQENYAFGGLANFKMALSVPKWRERTYAIHRSQLFFYNN